MKGRVWYIQIRVWARGQRQGRGPGNTNILTQRKFEIKMQHVK